MQKDAAQSLACLASVGLVICAVISLPTYFAGYLRNTYVNKSLVATTAVVLDYNAEYEVSCTTYDKETQCDYYYDHDVVVSFTPDPSIVYHNGTMVASVFLGSMHTSSPIYSIGQTIHGYYNLCAVGPRNPEDEANCRKHGDRTAFFVELADARSTYNVALAFFTIGGICAFCLLYIFLEFCVVPGVASCTMSIARWVTGAGKNNAAPPPYVLDDTDPPSYADVVVELI